MMRITTNPDKRTAKCVPNLLPCRVNQDGPANASPRYWDPKIAEDGNLESYFRGRKLKGKNVKVPDGYEGVVVKDAGKEHNRTQGQNTDTLGLENGNEGDEEEITILQDAASFDETILWDHEHLVEGDDAFVKGLGEWIGFAEAVSLLFVGRKLIASASASTNQHSVPRFITQEIIHNNESNHPAMLNGLCVGVHFSLSAS
ncbi:MAG: hypothetical protein Q9164_003499 [Protoblastenia rupestris]